ncbi:unnamed protein product [Ixodes persulcatus]
MRNPVIGNQTFWKEIIYKKGIVLKFWEHDCHDAITQSTSKHGIFFRPEWPHKRGSLRTRLQYPSQYEQQHDGSRRPVQSAFLVKRSAEFDGCRGQDVNASLPSSHLVK